MAWPIMNSPTFPSTADVPGLPPKLNEMPIVNPGTRTYLCEDGVTRVLTEEQALNLGISCRAIGPALAGGQALSGPLPPGPDPNATVVYGPVSAGPRYRVMNMSDRRVVRRF